MRTLTNFWRTLEDIRTLAAVEDEWRFRIGDEYDLARPFLRPAGVRAASYPQLDGGLPYEVVRHAEDDIVGVCPESGRRIVLRESQLIVYELDRRRLAQGIANTFGIETSGAKAESESRLLRLGRIVLTQVRHDCYFLIPTESADVDFAVLRLVTERRSPFILFVTTWSPVRGATETQVQQHGSLILAMTDETASERPGVLRPTRPVKSWLTIRPDDSAPEFSAPHLNESRNVFRAEGDIWTLRFAGKAIRMRNYLGLQYIAYLLASKGRDVAADALKAAAAGNTLVKPLAGIEVLDARARKAYKAEYESLTHDLEAAKAFGDLAKLEQIQVQLGFLADEISSATGLGGRSRKLKDERSNFRSSVKNAISRAIDNQIGPRHDALARHLLTSLRTGATLCYAPDPDVDWAL